jgi:hypothetical protein
MSRTSKPGSQSCEMKTRNSNASGRGAIDTDLDPLSAKPTWPRSRATTTSSLVIAEFGCGAFHRLIITGSTRGQVWFDDRAADGGLTPEADFPDWYHDWLRNRR